MKKFLTKTIGASLNTLAYIAPQKTARIGFELFCRPIRPTISAKQRAFLSSGRHETFEYKGTNIQTYRWGNGDKKLLMLHGWQSHTYRWRAYIEHLSMEYSVYGLDAPGHGLSAGKLLSVPLYSEVIEEQIKRIGEVDAIITHSLGGFAAFYSFYRNPSLPVSKLVTLASPGEAQEFFDFYTNMLRLTKKSTELVVGHFEKTFQKDPSFFSAPAFAETLEIPGLIIHDEEDAETPFYHAERIHSAWKSSRLIKTKGYGHNLRAQEVINAVIRFVNDPLSSKVPSQIAVNDHR